MRKSVGRRKSSISKAGSYSEIDKFWYEHELVEFWHKTRKIKVTKLNQTPIQAIPQKLQMNRHVNAIARTPEPASGCSGPHWRSSTADF